MENFRIRPLEAKDAAPWRALWQDYLAFYHVADLSPDVTASTWQRLLEKSALHGFVAEDSDGQLLGFTHIVIHPMTWSISQACYLEDLYVSEAARGQGIGRALIRAVYEFAQAYPCGRVYWVTNESNKTAQALYDKIAKKTDFIQYRKNLETQ